MVIFLTGSSGFIGRNLLEQLQHKYTVLAPTHKELDLLNRDAVENFFSSHHVDIVIHTAFVGGNRKMLYVPDAIEKNLRMFLNVSVHQNYFRKMICFGSGAEYDKRRPLKKIREDEFGKIIPADQYGFAKYLCSLLAQRSDKVTVLRLFGVFGRYEDYETRFISNAMCRIVLGMPILINRNVFFDYVYIDDLVRIIDYFISQNTKERFVNVGSGQRQDLVSIARQISTLTDKPVKIIVKQPGLNYEYTCDNTVLLHELGTFQFTDFAIALRELHQWYLHNEHVIRKERL